MTIYKELLDELLKGCELPEDLLGDAGPLTRLFRLRLFFQVWAGATPW